MRKESDNYIVRGDTKIHPEPDKNKADSNFMKGIAVTSALGIPVTRLIAMASTDPNLDGAMALGTTIAAISTIGGTWASFKHKKTVEGHSIDVGKQGRNEHERGTALVQSGQKKMEYGHEQAKSVGSEKKFLKKVFK